MSPFYARSLNVPTILLLSLSLSSSLPPRSLSFTLSALPLNDRCTAAVSAIQHPRAIVSLLFLPTAFVQAESITGHARLRLILPLPGTDFFGEPDYDRLRRKMLAEELARRGCVFICE